MPTVAKITKEMIIDEAFKIVREKGMEGLSNRELAKRLGCSIRPIYYQFKNVLELQEELMKRIEKYFYDFLFKKTSDDIKPYKQVGINYIRFAKEENKLFQILFMNEGSLILENYVTNNTLEYKELEERIRISTKIDDENIKKFHIKMWIFTHGLACLVASKTCRLTDKEISELLTEEFKALNSLK